jgi:cob(I)alamin adenosyltransferase
MSKDSKNRVVLITGYGKGKTTAALGMALRAAGHGMRVCVVQFIKGRADTGEVRALSALAGAEVHVCGAGFVRAHAGAESAEHRRAAEAGLKLASDKLRDPSLGMVILDEVCGAVSLGLISARDVLAALGGAAPGTVIVLTGRDAAAELVDAADTVSRVECVKHGMDAGWKAQAGVEW